MVFEGVTGYFGNLRSVDGGFSNFEWNNIKLNACGYSLDNLKSVQQVIDECQSENACSAPYKAGSKLAFKFWDGVALNTCDLDLIDDKIEALLRASASYDSDETLGQIRERIAEVTQLKMELHQYYEDLKSRSIKPKEEEVQAYVEEEEEEPAV